MTGKDDQRHEQSVWWSGGELNVEHGMAYARNNSITTSARRGLEHAEEGRSRGLALGRLVHVELDGAFS